MSVDRFGRYLRDKVYRKGPPGDGFQRTTQGDFDIQTKRLCNVGAPLDGKDAATHESVKKECQSLEEILSLRSKSLIEERFQVHNEKVIEHVNNAYQRIGPLLDNLVQFQETTRTQIENITKILVEMERIINNPSGSTPMNMADLVNVVGELEKSQLNKEHDKYFKAPRDEES